MKELSLTELNELIYCIGVAKREGALVNDKVATSLEKRLQAELSARCEEVDRTLAEYHKRFGTIVELQRGGSLDTVTLMRGDMIHEG